MGTTGENDGLKKHLDVTVGIPCRGRPDLFRIGKGEGQLMTSSKWMMALLLGMGLLTGATSSAQADERPNADGEQKLTAADLPENVIDALEDRDVDEDDIRIVERQEPGPGGPGGIQRHCR